MRRSSPAAHILLPALIIGLGATASWSQDQGDEQQSRQAILLEQRHAKTEHLTPYEISNGERRVLWAEET
jgi:hypothetical protein